MKTIYIFFAIIFATLAGWYSHTYYVLDTCDIRGVLKYNHGKLLCVYKPNLENEQTAN